MISTSDIDLQLIHITDSIKNSILQSFLILLNSLPTPGGLLIYQHLKKAAHHALNLYRYYPSPLRLNYLKLCRSNLRSAIKSAKTAYTVNNLDKITSPWHHKSPYCKHFTNPNLNHLTLLSSTRTPIHLSTQYPKPKLFFFDKFFLFLSTPTTSRSPEFTHYFEVTPYEIISILKTCKNKSSPGTDKISFKILKFLSYPVHQSSLQNFQLLPLILLISLRRSNTLQYFLSLNTINPLISLLIQTNISSKHFRQTISKKSFFLGYPS